MADERGRANTEGEHKVRPYGKAVLAVLAVWLITAGIANAAEHREEAVRFKAVDVFIDSKDQPLAAWQIELRSTGGDVKIVGIEGGEHAAFREPPYYDPAALNRNRVILAAFSTGQTLPTGRTRVARVHVQVSGTPEYQVKLIVAASADGKEIQATAAAGQGDEQ